MTRTYSYRVLKDGNWMWELVSPAGTIVRYGFAETQALATVQAMSTWLQVMNDQGRLEDDPVSWVRH